MGDLPRSRERARQGQWRLHLHRDEGAGFGPVREPGERGTVEEFLDWFPGVEEWQVRAVLEHEAKALRTPA